LEKRRAEEMRWEKEEMSDDGRRFGDEMSRRARMRLEQETSWI
jgi:hypothetical protein